MNRKNIAIGDWVTSQNKVGKIVKKVNQEEFFVLWSGDSLPMNELATSLQKVSYNGEDLAGKTFTDGRCHRLIYEYGVKAEVVLDQKKKPQVWSLEKLTNKLNSEKQPPFNQPIMLCLSQIRRDGGTQPRASINQETVMEYAEDMQNGDRFPPVTVFYDGEFHWLADGFHRDKAALKAGLTDIAAIVKQGTRRDAVLHSVGANAKHGLRRSNDDKRRAVITLLEDEEWSSWNVSEISRQAKVSRPFVYKIMEENSHLSTFTSERTYTTKHGTTAKMNTANIGKSKSSELSSPTKEEKEVTTPSEELNTVNEEQEVTTPTSEENNPPSDTSTNNEPANNERPNIRDLLSEGDRVRIKDHHYFGGQFGIVTFLPNRHSAVVEFSPGKREFFQLEDLDLPLKPQPPIKREIIIQEGLNYKVGNPDYGCKWYVEVSPETYQGLQKYREKVGTVTIDAAFARFLEEDNNPKPISSNDICLGLTSNLDQLTDDRIRFVVTAIAQSRPEIICQVAERVRTNYLMEKN